jgi:mono/diheme cytochrome c family protein
VFGEVALKFRFAYVLAAVIWGVGLPAFILAAVGGPQAGTITVPPAAHAEKNPLKRSKESLLAGAAVYREQCAGCHGATGTPERRFPSLAIQPAKLGGATVERLSDGDIFWIISNGAPGGMPSFKDDLTTAQRWQAILFVRRLNKDAAKYLAELPPQEGK